MRLIKITSATSLLELQQVLYVEGLIMEIDFVNSAAAWRATLRHGDHRRSWIAIGRTIGEAIESALTKYEEVG